MGVAKVDKFVGIDVSKTTLDLMVRPTGTRQQQANDADGIAQLIKQLRKIRPTLVVCEATGGWERLLVGALAAARLPIVVVNPRQVRDFAKATGRLAKTDRLDAEVIAGFADAVRPEPRALPSADAEALDDLVTLQVADHPQRHGAGRPYLAAGQTHFLTPDTVALLTTLTLLTFYWSPDWSSDVAEPAGLRTLDDVSR